MQPLIVSNWTVSDTLDHRLVHSLSKMTFEVEASEGNCANCLLLGSGERTKLEHPPEQLVDVADKPDECGQGGEHVEVPPEEPVIAESEVVHSAAILPATSSKFRGGQYCGLKNLGNTCYSNSILQTLFSLNRIRQHFLKNHDTTGDKPFHQILSRLFTSMRKLSSQKNASSAGIAIKPDEFCREFRRVKPQFLRNEQHDAQEFLALLLDLLHDECNSANQKLKRVDELKSAHEAWTQHVAAVDDSFFSKHLMGQTESCLSCHGCGNKSLSWNCFWQLPLAVSEIKPGEPTGTLTLLDCINEYMEAEVLSDDCAPFCGKCKRHETASKKLTVVRSPHYLVVHLKRFAYSGSKITRPVEIVNQFELCSKRYSLCCCVLHRGSEVHQGHYTTLAYEESNTWVLCDDDTITHGVSAERGRKMMQRYAYLCVYKSVNSSSNGELVG